MNSYVIIFSTFILGLTGGFGHCVMMCHPFVLYISTKFTAIQSVEGILLPQIKYNLGRITTYAFLGMIAGGFGSLISENRAAIGQKILFIAAGVLLVIYSLGNLTGKHFSLPKKLNALIKRFPLFASPYLTGVVLGFLPCGFILSALITSAVSTNILTGALSMAVFGIGTAAALLLLSFFGGAALKYISVARWIFLLIIFLMGVYFIYKGIFLENFTAGVKHHH